MKEKPVFLPGCNILPCSLKTLCPPKKGVISQVNNAKSLFICIHWPPKTSPVPCTFSFLEDTLKPLCQPGLHPATRQEPVILPSASLDVMERRGSELGSGAGEFLHRRKRSWDLTFLPQCFQKPPSHIKEQFIAGY